VSYTGKVWAQQAMGGLRDIVEIKSVIPERTPQVRHVVSEADTPGGDTARLASSPAAAPATSSAASGVQLLERATLPHDYLLEVSVLETLGFYDPAAVVSVSVDSAPGKAAVGSLPRPDAIVPPQRKSLIPDIDLSNWKPHVIARSKLGKGRLSSMAIVGLSVTLVILVALVAGLVRGHDLTVALTELDPILADATTDVAEATPLLIAVDDSARLLFDAAAQLGDNPEQQVLRQSATSVAERALDLESLLGDALSYRLVLNPLWRSPELAGLVDATQAAAAIATWQSQLGDMADTLPRTPELSGHVTLVQEFIADLDDWRFGYMDALAVDDLAGAEAAVADLEGQLALLAQSGEETLTTIFADAGVERRSLLANLGSIAS
jgi:hypothetical protein